MPRARRSFPAEFKAQIVLQLLSGEASQAELCRKHGISTATFFNWKAKFGGLEVSEARKLRTLEDENRRLKKLLAEAMLDNAMLKDPSGGRAGRWALSEHRCAIAASDLTMWHCAAGCASLPPFGDGSDIGACSFSSVARGHT